MSYTVNVVERWAITSQIIATLGALGFAIGDNSAPAAGTYGWQGEPNAAGDNFVPWVSVSPMPGTPDTSTMDIADSGFGIWILSYAVFSAGVTREQCERLADRLRKKFVNMANVECQGEAANWRIQIVRCTSVGSNNRVGEAIPYHYTQTDTFVVRVTEG